MGKTSHEHVAIYWHECVKATRPLFGRFTWLWLKVILCLSF